MEVERVDRVPAEMAEICGLGDEVRLDAYPGGLPAFVRPQDERLAENPAMFLAWLRKTCNERAEGCQLLMYGPTLRARGPFRAVSGLWRSSGRMRGPAVFIRQE